ncbi:hypothetical protein PF008_g5095 [Phytophthora fragariae]|uniref:SET domain-containing protein n=1 Tax=Phytophthora fragariae TaxID=53985 RepID=A0A6G0SA06_9STRA|nr:hypothetical protein PF008_g5095 [Phytophthora fragariae]
MKVLLRIPDLRAKLVDVRKKKPVYIPSSQHDPNDAETDVMVSIPFLDYVSEISENIVPEGLKFVDAGDVDPRGRLLRALVPERGRRVLLHARHLPARRAVQQRSTSSGLARSFGVLREFAGVRGHGPEEVMKENSGYPMLLNEKIRQIFVRRGVGCWINREILTARVRPNVQFVEMQNMTQVKVLYRTISTVDVGAQITVSYGKEIWFKFACDPCWKEHLSQT